MQPKSRGRVRWRPPTRTRTRSSNTATTASRRTSPRYAPGPSSRANWPVRQRKSATVSWSTSQHLSSTAPMGNDDDAAAVVDPQCRVRGVDGLWVVDGSVLPAITSRGPHATIVMIGHRAAEFIT